MTKPAKPDQKRITLTVPVTRERLAAIRYVRGFAISSASDLRHALDRILDDELEEIVADYRERLRERPLEDRSVGEIDFSARVAEVLRAARIHVVRQLAELSQGELEAKLAKFTKQSAKIAREVADELERFGVRQPGTDVGRRGGRPKSARQR